LSRLLNEFAVTGIRPTGAPAPAPHGVPPSPKRVNVPLDTVDNREAPGPRLTARQQGVMKRFDAFLHNLNNTP
jgi:hypothetical protein